MAAIIPAADEVDAIRLANDSSYGLGAAVFTGSRELSRFGIREFVNSKAIYIR